MQFESAPSTEFAKLLGLLRNLIAKSATKGGCKLKPSPLSLHGQAMVNTPRDLVVYIHDLMRADATRRLLQSPYQGSYKILEYEHHLFRLNVGGKPKTITLDKLKSFSRGQISLGGRTSVVSALTSANRHLRPSNHVTGFSPELP